MLRAVQRMHLLSAQPCACHQGGPGRHVPVTSMPRNYKPAQVQVCLSPDVPRHTQQACSVPQSLMG